MRRKGFVLLSRRDAGLFTFWCDLDWGLFVLPLLLRGIPTGSTSAINILTVFQSDARHLSRVKFSKMSNSCVSLALSRHLSILGVCIQLTSLENGDSGRRVDRCSGAPDSAAASDSEVSASCNLVARSNILAAAGRLTGEYSRPSKTSFFKSSEWHS